MHNHTDEIGRLGSTVHGLKFCERADDPSGILWYHVENTVGFSSIYLHLIISDMYFGELNNDRTIDF